MSQAQPFDEFEIREVMRSFISLILLSLLRKLGINRYFKELKNKLVHTNYE